MQYNDFDKEIEAGLGLASKMLRRQKIFRVIGFGIVIIFVSVGIKVSYSVYQFNETNENIRQTNTAIASTIEVGHVSATQTQASIYSLATATAVGLDGPEGWRLSLYEPFDGPKSKLYVGQYDGDNYTGETKIDDGNFLWEVNQTNREFFQSSRPLQPEHVAFFVQVDVKRLHGDKITSCYGLQFRINAENGNFYVLEICNEHAFRVRLYRGAGEWEDLSGPGRITAQSLIPGDWNRLAVMGQGSHFTFWANDVLLLELNDSRLKTGYEGLFISNQAGEALFVFDNFILRIP